MKLTRFIGSILFLTCGIFLAGCNGGGSDGTDATTIQIDDSVIATGQSTVVTTGFSFDSDAVFDENHNVVLVIHIPRGLSFHGDAGEINLPTGSDRRVGAEITACSGGDYYVVFDLDRSDLLTATNPTGDADAEIKFQLDAHTATTTILEARADEDHGQYACGQEFSAQAVASIEVTAP